MRFIITQSATGAYTTHAGIRYDVKPLPAGVLARGTGIQSATDLAEALLRRRLVAVPVIPPTKAELLKQLKAKRDAVQYADFAYLDTRIQCDDLSRANINTAATNAMIATDAQWPADFAWRSADNSWLPLNRALTLAMSAVFGQFLASCFSVFATKAAQIEAGEPCDINTGWPE